MAGNATPMMSRMKKIADISAIGNVLSFCRLQEIQGWAGKSCRKKNRE